MISVYGLRCMRCGMLTVLSDSEPSPAVRALVEDVSSTPETLACPGCEAVGGLELLFDDPTGNDASKLHCTAVHALQAVHEFTPVRPYDVQRFFEIERGVITPKFEAGSTERMYLSRLVGLELELELGVSGGAVVVVAIRRSSETA